MEATVKSAISTLDLHSYDYVLVAFSGGKDSICSLLTLLELGVDPGKIELHHHLVDGREGSRLFDWPCTESYCRRFATAFDLPLYFSWLEGGLERELTRNNASKAPTHFETPAGEQVVGGHGPRHTRRKFPAKTADLNRRWCSAYAKIDVLDISINNQPRFNHSKTLVVTGERTEESGARAKLPVFTKHRCDRSGSQKLCRQVDHWRPVHHLKREQIWQMLQRWRIQAHPAYYLGWSRLSCQRCIFGSPSQWASNYAISPGETHQMHQYELTFDHTLDNHQSIPQMAAKGRPYSSITPEYTTLALSRKFTAAIFLAPNIWQLPAGAMGEQVGPS